MNTASQTYVWSVLIAALGGLGASVEFGALGMFIGGTIGALAGYGTAYFVLRLETELFSPDRKISDWAKALIVVLMMPAIPFGSLMIALIVIALVVRPFFV